MTYVIKTFKALRFVCGTFLLPIIIFLFKLFNRSTDYRNPLPPVDNPLILMPAHELARRIRKREVCFHKESNKSLQNKKIKTYYNIVKEFRFG